MGLLRQSLAIGFIAVTSALGGAEGCKSSAEQLGETIAYSACHKAGESTGLWPVGEAVKTEIRGQVINRCSEHFGYGELADCTEGVDNALKECDWYPEVP